VALTATAASPDLFADVVNPEASIQAPAAEKPATRGRPGPLIGEIIVDMGFADRETLERCVLKARESGLPTGKVLLADEVITPDQLARALAKRFGLEHIDLNTHKIDMAAANLVSPSAAKRLNAVPVGFVGNATLLVAMADPANVLAVDDIAMLTGYNVRPAVASEEDITGLITRLNRFEDAVQEAVEEEEDTPAEITDLRESADDAPVIKLVRSIIAQAVDQSASDIHFEPEDGELVVRFRIDGVLVDTTTVPTRMSLGVVSRLKLMADLDISERRVPQDGRIGVTVEDRHVDIRVVSLPLVHSESVVLRILDQGAVPLDLDQLGMSPDARQRFETSLRRTHGSILATGPTGSGKSTTLYAALMSIRSREKSIVTIEDPVEYQLDGIKQVQVNHKRGMTFATGLRSMMRADPDILMVGEIRDHDSAQIGIEAALTGHLLLSTLHTNDAATAVTRLIEMGVEPYLVASAVDCVVAQRLVRRLCSSCKSAKMVPASALNVMEDDAPSEGFRIFEPVGCARCGGNGYRGRIGLFEVMKVSEKIRSLIMQRSDADAITDVAVSEGMRRLREDAMEKIKAGETSFAELGRVTDA
jgi:type IV pilus assembly protein PilB